VEIGAKSGGYKPKPLDALDPGEVIFNKQARRQIRVLFMGQPENAGVETEQGGARNSPGCDQFRHYQSKEFGWGRVEEIISLERAFYLN
jgi:hypothetical protein